MNNPTAAGFHAISVQRLSACLMLSLFAGWMICNLVQTGGYIIADYSGLPSIDYWHRVFQHHQDRIGFPELIFSADVLFLHGRLYLPIAISALCYFLTWFVMAWAAYSSKAGLRTACLLALALAGIVMFWKGCSTSIAEPFQLTFTFALLSGSLAFAFLAKFTETGSRRYLLALIAAGAVAIYSIADGMWISGNIAHGPQNVLAAPSDLCSFLGMPFASERSAQVGITLGVLNLLLAIGCFVLAWRLGVLKSRIVIVVFGSYAFILAVALVTSFGEWRRPGPTMPSVAWAALTIALIRLLAEHGRISRTYIAAALLGGLFYCGFRNSDNRVESNRAALRNAQIVAIMLRNNVFDPATAIGMFPASEPVRELSIALRTGHQSIFTRGDDKWLGHDIKTLSLRPAFIPGKITRVVPVPGGLEIIGWAANNWLTGDHPILFVDEQNRIAGFAQQPAAHFPPEMTGWDLPAELAFVGFVSLTHPARHLAVYTRTYHGKILQPIEGGIDVPAVTAIANSAATPLPRVLSTSHLGETDSAPIPVSPDHCLVLPERHSQSIYGLSLQLQDADTRKPIATLPLIEDQTIWKRWQVPIPESVRSVIIKSAQESSDTWLAVGAPEHCPTSSAK